MASLSDKRVTYVHDPSTMTVGDKRNLLVERSRGQYIVHFDDDDYYAPDYVSYMLTMATQLNAELVKLSAFFLFHINCHTYAYCDLRITDGLHFTWSKDFLRGHVIRADCNSFLADNSLGYGFSYVYKRILWEGHHFSSLDWDEDRTFAKQINSSRVIALPDTVGLCIHMLHPDNLSSCFPQFILPEFLALKSFPMFKNHLVFLERRTSLPGIQK
jgi:glycosyltransferase involved in cell wall biosynthesis